MSELLNIKVSMLYPHPDNPRKDLGDLSELSESIKANGILQNLTVVPGHFLTDKEWKEVSKQYKDNPSEELRSLMNDRKSADGYTVIIGHRRLAAAKLAGIEELPCSVADMDLLEQRRTMLMENMQRADLTPYEQAKGFQMMIDLGATAAQIAKDTGFSESTVKQRIRWARLDEKTFEKVSTRQISIADLNKVGEIEDAELQRKALDALRTKNFDNVFNDSKNQDKFNKKRDEWIAILETFAEKIDKCDWSRMDYIQNLSKWNSDKTLEVPEDAETATYYYTVGTEVSIYKAKSTEKTAKEAEKEARKEENRKLDNRLREEFENLSKQMFMKRINFLQKFSPKKAELSKLMRITTELLMENAFDWRMEISADTFFALSGIDCDEKGDMSEINEQDFPFNQFREKADKAPELMLFYQVYSMVDEPSLSYADHRWVSDEGRYMWVHRDAIALDRIYLILEEIGYEVSDIEGQLADGTYPSFEKINKEE